MTTRTLRQIMEEASVTIANGGDVPEARERLNEIVHALGTGDISGDRILSLEIRDGMVFFTTQHRYSCGGRMQEDMRNFPQTVLDAEDPARCAREWVLSSRLDLARSGVDRAREELDVRTKYLDQVQAQYDRFRSGADERYLSPAID